MLLDKIYFKVLIKNSGQLLEIINNKNKIINNNIAFVQNKK